MFGRKYKKANASVESEASEVEKINEEVSSAKVEEAAPSSEVKEKLTVLSAEEYIRWRIDSIEQAIVTMEEKIDALDKKIDDKLNQILELAKTP